MKGSTEDKNHVKEAIKVDKNIIQLHTNVQRARET